MHHTVLGTIPKSNIKIVERGETDAPYTQIHDRSLACLGTDISIKSGGVFFFSFMWSKIYSFFPHLDSNI
jgi:hypothetical protein